MIQSRSLFGIEAIKTASIHCKDEESTKKFRKTQLFVFYFLNNNDASALGCTCYFYNDLYKHSLRFKAFSISYYRLYLALPIGKIINQAMNALVHFERSLQSKTSVSKPIPLKDCSSEIADIKKIQTKIHSVMRVILSVILNDNFNDERDLHKNDLEDLHIKSLNVIEELLRRQNLFLRCKRQMITRLIV